MTRREKALAIVEAVAAALASVIGARLAERTFGWDIGSEVLGGVVAGVVGISFARRMGKRRKHATGIAPQVDEPPPTPSETPTAGP